MPRHSRKSLVLVSLLLGATPALADPAADVPATLTGEWGGLRTDLRDDGIDVTGGYTSEAATNVSGGTSKDATETAQLTLGVKADTEKLFGLQGGTFQMTLTHRRGHNLTQTAGLDTLLQTQEVYGRGQTVRLTEFWYQQDLGAGLDIKAGRLPTGGDFSSFPCNHMNGSFCGAPIGNIGGDFWYNWPVSQWAARLRFQHNNWYVMAGAYEVNPRNLDNDFVLGHFHGATGVLAPVEFGVHTRMGSGGLPGLYQVGGWYSSDNADDVLLGTDRRPAILASSERLQRSGRYGGFMLLQQQLTGTASSDDPGKAPQTTHGLTAFVTVTQADRNTARIDNQITAGLRYLGLVPGRPQDSLQLAAARTHVNGRASLLDVLQVPGADRAGSEYAIEFDYGLQVTPWLNVQPNVEYIVNPGALDRTDVVTLGVKTAITL
jgi:porin